MKEIIIDGFSLNKEYKKRLLDELKTEGIKTENDLEHYLKDYWYTKDMALKSHLLLSRNPKRRNFSLPFDDQ